MIPVHKRSILLAGFRSSRRSWWGKCWSSSKSSKPINHPLKFASDTRRNKQCKDNLKFLLVLDVYIAARDFGAVVLAALPQHELTKTCFAEPLPCTRGLHERFLRAIVQEHFGTCHTMHGEHKQQPMVHQKLISITNRHAPTSTKTTIFQTRKLRLFDMHYSRPLWFQTISTINNMLQR